jgi:hypothetical protein
MQRTTSAGKEAESSGMVEGRLKRTQCRSLVAARQAGKLLSISGESAPPDHWTEEGGK